MQTFLPYSDFTQTAKALHYRHLGKQRVETKQIFTALTTGKGWVHHPATKMWKGYEHALLQYGQAICTEWIRRGYKDSLLEEFISQSHTLWNFDLPPWLGDAKFHESHRSNLMRKKPDFYKFEDTKVMLPYQWPVLVGNGYYLKEGKKP